ncbi:alcohol dehydrogenase [Ilyonectria sp. MPI-CAGE-AT-0026]|nr:alcohol dehydrogenase [Ilyonectria sp. MPI-CAGE-AT-0026]
MVLKSSTMKAALVVRSSTGFKFRISSIAIPPIGPLEILVQLSATGVCGTDMALASGEVGPTCQILGHEGIGRVVQVGQGVPASDVQVNDRVGIAWLRDICGKCAYCLHPGGETRCAEQLNSGRKIDGTFAEYAVVPARYLVRIPDHVKTSDEMLAPILCGGVTAYKALRVCGASGGQWVAVLGAAGGVGAFAIQYARAMGLRVLAIDAGEAKGKYCLELGAEKYIDVVDTTDLAAQAAKLTGGRGISAALAIAGSAKGYQAALEILGPFGTLVCVGIPPPHELVSFHPLLFIDKGIKIVGSAVGTREDILDAIEFVERGLVKSNIVRATLLDLPKIAKEFGKANGKYVIKYNVRGTL